MDAAGIYTLNATPPILFLGASCSNDTIVTPKTQVLTIQASNKLDLKSLNPTTFGSCLEFGQGCPRSTSKVLGDFKVCWWPRLNPIPLNPKPLNPESPKALSPNPKLEGLLRAPLGAFRVGASLRREVVEFLGSPEVEVFMGMGEPLNNYAAWQSRFFQHLRVDSYELIKAG